jgi:xanthine dehydrogenase accessory factor
VRARAQEVLVEAGRLAAAGEPFALATVVSVRRPASARRGDRAIVTADGALVGWVGGACSEPVVVREALRAVAEGTPRLVRIGPSGTAAGPGEDVVCAESHCASEGTVEVLVEPQLPGPLLAVVGDGPAARTLAELARTIGWRVTAEPDEGADAVVVATMGTRDEEALAAALALSAGYVALVASAKRAGVVLGHLREQGMSEEELASVRSPAGLDLGPCTQEEIAVAVLAELVAWRHAHAPAAAPPAEALDPVCGMTVSVEGAAATAEHEGVTYYFCCPHCRTAFLAEPARYLEEGSPR